MIDFPYDRILEVVSLRDDMLEKFKNHKIIRKLWYANYKFRCKLVISSFRKGEEFSNKITIRNLLNFSKFAYQAKYKYKIHISINMIEGDTFCNIDFKNINTIISVSNVSEVISVTRYSIEREYRIDYSELSGDLAKSVYDEIMNYTVKYLLGDAGND